MKTRGPGKRAHTGFVPGGVGCMRCGGEQPFPPVMTTEVMQAIAKAFDKQHKACDLDDDRGAKRFLFETAEEWDKCWDVGISSLTIWSVCMGRGLALGEEGVPRDPADFGRCYRLLAKLPKWRALLPEVAKRYPEWSRLVDRWGELTKLYEEELPTGSAPKLWALLEKLTSSPAGAS